MSVRALWIISQDKGENVAVRFSRFELVKLVTIVAPSEKNHTYKCLRLCYV